VATVLTARRVLVDDGRVDESEAGRPDPEVEPKAKRRTFTAEYKARILAEYDAAGHGEKGAILRRERLYSAHLVEWRRAAEAGQAAALSRPRGRPAADPREKELERLRAELARKDKELEASRRVIDIMGKANALLEALSESMPELSRESSRKENG
jgi:transposase-like protein